MGLNTTLYNIKAPIDMKIALVADIHTHAYSETVNALRAVKPTIITVAGDFAQGDYIPFLHELSRIAPTFVGLGNHDMEFASRVYRNIDRTGAVLLDNRHVSFRGTLIGGLSTSLDLDWLDCFSGEIGYKILICHHPEYYKKYVRKTSVNLMLSGHAHGGQVRIFQRGLYAPGQGIFPRFTGGVYENRLVVSRGIANTAPIPRIFNTPEVVCIRLSSNSGMC